MTKQLVSTYNLMINNSLKEIVNDLKDDRLTVIKLLKEFGAIILSIISLLLLSFTSFFNRWRRNMNQERIGRLERNVDNIVHELI
jgi:1,4-dihydroxy-2-naphthoate octaprenyltransferase